MSPVLVKEQHLPITGQTLSRGLSGEVVGLVSVLVS